MTAVVLAVAGLSVVYLGADAPTADIAVAARERNAAAVVISLSVASNRFMSRRDISELRENLDRDVDLLVGGLGAPDGLPGVMHLPDLPDLADWAARIAT
jgi:methylmalonyl-CoA mutase cobalamin-binding subunit